MDKPSDLRNFIADTKSRIENLLKQFHWNETDLLKNHNSTNNTNSIQNVTSICRNQKQIFPYSSVDNRRHCVTLDTATLQGLLKLESNSTPPTVSTFDDLQSSYDTSQKLAIYEHIVEQTRPPCTHPMPTLEDNAGFVELVNKTKQEQKKQRRYRKTKSTLNEKIHQVIELQMQALTKQWQEQEQKHRRCQQREESKQKDRGEQSRYRSGRTDPETRKREYSHRSNVSRHSPTRSRQRSRSSSRRRNRSHSRRRSRSREREHRRKYHHHHLHHDEKRHRSNSRRSRSRSTTRHKITHSKLR